MKTVLVTGATDGIGKQTALELAGRGFRVMVHGRSIEKAEAARQAIARASGRDDVLALAGDFARLAEVRALAASVAAHGTLDVLINNAGIYAEERGRTEDGFEITFGVNHLAPFLLTHLLLSKIPDDGRILFLSSVAHQRGQIDAGDFAAIAKQSGYTAYATSKLANVLTAFELAHRTRASVNALHPGVITTKLLARGFGVSGASLEEGAATSVKLASDPALAGVTGRYFSDGQEALPSRASRDRALQTSFYLWSAGLVGVAPASEIAAL